MFTPKQIKTFNEMEMNMYHFINSHKELIPYMTIRELASQVHTSPTSVLRLCKKIGCEGFAEFKLRYKQMLKNDEKSRISYSDDKISLFQDFLAKVETPSFVDRMKKAVALVKQYDKLFCVGAGPTGSIAYYAATHLSAAGYFALYNEEHYMLSTYKLTPDLYIMFCVSGESMDMIDIAHKIKEHGGKILLISNGNFSTLAGLADVVIAYNLYYAKSVQKTVPTLSGHEEDMEYVVDSFSTQLPTVYIIEYIAGKL